MSEGLNQLIKPAPPGCKNSAIFNIQSSSRILADWCHEEYLLLNVAGNCRGHRGGLAPQIEFPKGREKIDFTFETPAQFG